MIGSRYKCQYVQQHATPSAFTSSESWVILSPIEQSIKRKIEAVGKPLKDWDIQINYGIKTGCNEAFIIDEAKRAEILSNCQNEDERKRTEAIIRPILRGRDIRRYDYVDSGKYLINTHNGVKEKGIPPIDVTDYPAIKDHLDSFGDAVMLRSDQGDTPYNLRNCAYLEEFEKPKIIYPNMTKYMPFFYDELGMYTNQKCFILTGRHLHYLIAFLNSSIFKICYRESFPELQGGTRELSKIFFENILIPVLPEIQMHDFENLVDDLIQGKDYSDTRLEEALRIALGLTPEEKDYAKSFIIQ